MKASVSSEFVWVRGARRVVLVHGAVQRTLGKLLMHLPHGPPPGGTALPGGRHASYRITLDGGDVAVMRLCRRGGVAGRVLHDLYFGRDYRPFAEVAVTEEARRRGVAAPAALGARVDRLVAGWYRGTVVTRYLGGAESLWEALRAADRTERARLGHAAGQALLSLCVAFVDHPDLNLQNLLVRGREAGGVEAFVIDFDRARLVEGQTPVALWERMFARLTRSARKLDREGRVVTPEVLEIVRERSRPEP